MQVPLLDLRAQYARIQDEVEPAMLEVCRGQVCVGGPKLAEFEANAAKYCGCKHAVGVSSGTDALLLALMAIESGAGDEVITPAFTFGATAEVIARVGATPVFVDVDEDTFNVRADIIEEKITDKTRGIIVVHLFGQMAQMDPIMALAKKHGLFVIEDACQSIGASQGGVRCGGIGDYGCFSFYPTKNLGCFGDGGMVTCNSDDAAATARTLRNHGQHAQYGYQRLGGNFRMDALQAAVLDVKLKRLDEWSAGRAANARRYNELLAGSGVKCPVVEEGNVSVYNQYTIKAPRRNELRAFLSEAGIGAGVYYPSGLHLEECFRDLGYSMGDLPVTERLCEEVLSLPIYPELRDEQIEYVAGKIRQFYK